MGPPALSTSSLEPEHLSNVTCEMPVAKRKKNTYRRKALTKRGANTTKSSSDELLYYATQRISRGQRVNSNANVQETRKENHAHAQGIMPTGSGRVSRDSMSTVRNPFLLHSHTTSGAAESLHTHTHTHRRQNTIHPSMHPSIRRLKTPRQRNHLHTALIQLTLILTAWQLPLSYDPNASPTNRLADGTYFLTAIGLSKQM